MSDAPGRQGTARRRTAVLALSLGWCIVACVWVVLEFAGERPTSQIVDRREEIGALLDRRRDPDGGSFGRDLKRVPVGPEDAHTLFGALSSPYYEYDPLLFFRHASLKSVRCDFREHPDGGWTVRTNSLGMREDQEVSAEYPDLRILLAGDSQTEGVCANTETVASELERELAPHVGTVEVLNAATGGYGPHNYLGVIERYGYLKPDVFLVVIYEGNDYHNVMRMQRYFHGRGPPNNEPYQIPKSHRDERPLLYAQVTQLRYFLNNPADVPIAIDTLCALSLEVARVCSQAGARPLFAYLPGPLTGQRHLYEKKTREFFDAMPFGVEELDLFRRQAEQYLAFLREHDISYVDLRRSFREAEQRLFWNKDLHLNLDGNRLVARELAEVLLTSPFTR